MSVQKIMTEWKKKTFKSVYWFEGEESYFIDLLTDYAEHHILSASEAEFNLTVFYGKDADWTAVINACRRYPMFAEKQVVLLKEAQQMKDIDRLEGYVQNPLPSTVFVVAYKEKKLDGRGSFSKLLKKGGYLLSEKIKEYQLAEWAAEMIAQKGLSISQKGLMLIVDHIGNDLSRLQNEVEKLTINLKGRKNITEDDIEEFIGISKEFNVFELQDAVAKKDLSKAIRIIQYFSANPKAGPIQLILPTFYNYFSKVYAIAGMEDKSEQNIKSLFYNNSFAAKQALQTNAAYGFKGIEKTLLLLHTYNLRSVGVNDSGTEDADLLKELVIKMMQH
jgi:DNA polymerase III subunit delta